MRWILLLALVPFAMHAAEEGFDHSKLKLFTAGGNYLDKFEMGLYPGGTSQIPLAHRAPGERIASSITPLYTDGKPGEGGRILALALGHSNCQMYFSALQEHLKQNSGELNPRFELVNAAVGGQQLPEIHTLKGGVWDQANKLLSRPGYSPQQVQVLFFHTTYHGWKNKGKTPARPFPQTMKQMQTELADVLAHCVKIFPNLKICYVTCDGLRHYTDFEPHVWQEAFAFKWLIESQIKGDAGTAFEDKPGQPRTLPWLAWGPYIWDNAWDQSYFTDGVHPAPKARAIFVQKYWDQLKQDPTARPWLLSKPKISPAERPRQEGPKVLRPDPKGETKPDL